MDRPSSPIRPLRDRIAVQPDRYVDSAAGLLVRTREGLTESRLQLGRTGTVLAVGPGKVDRRGQMRPLNLSPGDRVAFGEFNYPRLNEYGSVPVLLLQEADVIGVIEDSE